MVATTLGTRGFFSLASGSFVLSAAYRDTCSAEGRRHLTETGNRAWKASGTQGRLPLLDEETLSSAVCYGTYRLLCYLMVGIRGSGISIQMTLLMLFGWSLMWIASLILREYQWGSRSTLSQSGWCPVLLARSLVSKNFSFVENVTEFKKQSSNIRTHYWN